MVEQQSFTKVNVVPDASVAEDVECRIVEIDTFGLGDLFVVRCVERLGGGLFRAYPDDQVFISGESVSSVRRAIERLQQDFYYGIPRGALLGAINFPVLTECKKTNERGLLFETSLVC